VIFRDRVEAGERLAERLSAYRQATKTIVLGIPRGGIVVGAAMARDIELPLGICPVRKLGAPGNPELALGAVDEAEGRVIDRDLVRKVGISPADLDEAIAKERFELRRWLARLGEPVRDVKGWTVILTDDGIATGATARAGIQSVKRKGAGEVLLAVPVAPPDTVELLRPTVDQLLVIATPSPFYAVGNFFESWPQVTDQEVRGLLHPQSPN
jgi:putative phosphoribosyl transferase